MEILKPTVPIDLIPSAIKDARDDLKKHGIKEIKFHIIVNKDDFDEIHLPLYMGNGCIGIEPSKHMNIGAWMIVDVMERYIYYSKGA